jgi:serine/threonine protein phosphatase PrpC
MWRWGDENFMIGIGTMQGPRKTMEDSHLVRLIGSPLPEPIVEQKKAADENGGGGIETLPMSEILNTPNEGGDESQRLLVGVFDGHNGDRVAKYLKQTIPVEVENIKNKLSKKVT